MGKNNKRDGKVLEKEGKGRKRGPILSLTMLIQKINSSERLLYGQYDCNQNYMSVAPGTHLWIRKRSV